MSCMPKLGHTVIFHQDVNARPINGSKSHPAIITRVWSDDMVNLTIFPDLGAPFTLGSVGRQGSKHQSPEAAFWTPVE